MGNYRKMERWNKVKRWKMHTVMNKQRKSKERGKIAPKWQARPTITIELNSTHNSTRFPFDSMLFDFIIAHSAFHGSSTIASFLLLLVIRRWCLQCCYYCYYCYSSFSSSSSYNYYCYHCSCCYFVVVIILRGFRRLVGLTPTDKGKRRWFWLSLVTKNPPMPAIQPTKQPNQPTNQLTN